MGGQPSRTRKLTLDNDDPANVIKVSDDVVQRLRSSEARTRKDTGALIPQHVPSAGPPPPYYHYEPTITSLQVRQEAAEKLKKNDEYWARRLAELEKNNEKMKIIMDEEFKRAMEDMKAKEGNKSLVTEMPCVANRRKVMQCYQQYPNEPMRCAKEVQAFAACVDTKRVNVVDNRG